METWLKHKFKEKMNSLQTRTVVIHFFVSSTWAAVKKNGNSNIVIIYWKHTECQTLCRQLSEKFGWEESIVHRETGIVHRQLANKTYRS